MSGRDGAELPRVPVLVKREDRPTWNRREPVFYVLAQNSLMICRNHPFFRSCAPARGFPPGLARQESFLEPRYPKLSRRLFEQVVGFFDRAATLHGAEAAVLLVFDPKRKRVGVLVPEQEATVLRSWNGGLHPIGLDYYPPTGGRDGLVTLGDVHSHTYLPAYASSADMDDESYRPGLHIVVGRIHQEPPEIHVEAVADGTRFPLDPEDVLGGYVERRTDFPRGWLEKLSVKEQSSTLKPLKAWD